MSIDIPIRLDAAPTLRDWVLWVSLGELAGFCVPAVAGAAILAIHRGWDFVLLVAAGAVEGLVLGLAQSPFLRTAAGIPRRPWVLATAFGAAVAWTLGMLPSTFASTWAEWRPASAAVVATGLGVVLLLSVGTAQWVVLRGYVDRAAGWITATALAWGAGLTVFTMVTTPLWQPGQPLGLVALIGVVAAVPMAVAMATVTGLWLRRRALL